MKSKIFIVIVGIVIYILPIVTIFLISNEEIKKYQTKQIEFIDSAYGKIYQVEQRDIYENISVDATAVLNDTMVIYGKEDTVWVVSKGEEVNKNQVIGYCKDNPIKGEK